MNAPMKHHNVTILTEEPTIVLLAEPRISEAGVIEMAKWVQTHRPDCVPEAGFDKSMWSLLPHDDLDIPHGQPVENGQKGRALTGNEVLCEIAGRKCYDSFADKAGKKTNREYMENIFGFDPMHSSILYHAKMTFFFAGVSRKFSHQFIRNYVGSDRDEEGSPSQESTRFTHHYGWYVAPPYVVTGGESWIRGFAESSLQNYSHYNAFLKFAINAWKQTHDGEEPKGSDRKEIYEAGAGYLSMSAETSFVWTTNPMALRKFFKERCHGAADAEIFRFAKKLARFSFERWPNLFVGKDLNGVRKELESR